MLSLAVTPFAAHAGGAHRAVSACADAFVDQRLSGRTVVVRKMNPAPSPLEAMARRDRYTVDLEARGRRGQRIAGASCVTSLQGEVIRLEDLAVSVR